MRVAPYPSRAASALLTRDRGCMYYIPWIATFLIAVHGGMIGLWIHFVQQAKDKSQEGLNYLTVTSSDLSRVEAGVIATAVISLVIIFIVMLVSFWRSFVEASHDATGLTGGAATSFMIINALAGATWYLVVLWLLLALSYTALWYWTVYLLQGSIMESMRQFSSLPPVAWIPSSGLPCPGQCYSLRYFVFLDSKFENSCTCDQTTLGNAQRAFAGAYDDLLPATIGIFLMVASAALLSMNLSSQFSHTKREKEMIERATHKQFEAVI